MHKLGLKLWSINTDYYYDEAIRLYNNGAFDYIELYVVPDTIDTINKWKKLNIPFSIHAPHFAHGLNFSDINKRDYNKNLVEQTKRFSNELNANYTIFHPGIGGSLDETLFQLSKISQFNFLIENKPYIVHITKLQRDDFCIGATYEQIKTILEKINCGLCLDIGHCISCANYLNFDPYVYVEKFHRLNPKAYHISDIDLASIYDQHLHFGVGSLDLNKIKYIFNKNSYIAIETNKDSKFNINDFENDAYQIRKAIKFNE